MKFAVDCSSWTGKLTTAHAQAIKDMGYSKAIVNLYGRSTAQSQIDAFQSVGMEVDGYIYFYFAQDPATRVDSLLANLEGRSINFLWLDWEDDTAPILDVPTTVDYISRASAVCVGKVYTGHYTRREWWMRRTGNSQAFAGQFLWDATNDKTPDMSYNPYGGFRHYMEQYAFDTQMLPAPVGLFDLNVYNDDPAPQPQPPYIPPLVDVFATLTEAKTSIQTVIDTLFEAK